MTDRSGGLADAANAEPRIEVGLATDVGKVRTGNEDSILCEPLESLLVAERGLFCAVADGMGGHAAGEDASSMAVKVARDAFYGASSDADPLEVLKLAVTEANAAVYDAGAGTTGRDHMGTTLTAAVLFNHRAVIGHVGDSRCYIVRGDAIRQLSRDHSWVAEEVEAGRMTPEQARVNPRRNIITRALGLRPEVDVDTYDARLEPGSIVVICSDGLHGLVSEEEILSYVRRLRPADAVDALIELANRRGGPDNISVVIARVLGAQDDEADTERGFPVISDAYTPTTRTIRADPSDAQALAGTPLPDATRMPEPPQPSEVTPASEPAPPRHAATGTPGTTSSAQAPPPASDPPSDRDPPAPPAPPAGQMVVRSTTDPEGSRTGGRGGVALLVVLILLAILGAGIGYLLFRMAGITP